MTVQKRTKTPYPCLLRIIELWLFPGLFQRIHPALPEGKQAGNEHPSAPDNERGGRCGRGIVAKKEKEEKRVEKREISHKK